MDLASYQIKAIESIVFLSFRSFTKVIKECLDFVISVKSFFGILFLKKNTTIRIAENGIQ